MTTTIILDDRQLAHVLAALRITQNLDDHRKMVAMEYFTELTGFPLETGEVDALCEAINCSPVLKAELVAHDGTPLDPTAMFHALIDLIEWDAFMGFNEAVVWKNARLAMGHSVEGEEDPICSRGCSYDPEETPNECPDCGLTFCDSCYDTTKDTVGGDTCAAHAEEEEEADVTLTRAEVLILVRVHDLAESVMEGDDEANHKLADALAAAVPVWHRLGYHGVPEDEEEGRACRNCATKLDPGEGVDTEDGLLCYDCDQYQGPCSDEESPTPTITPEQRGNIADLLGDLETRVGESLHDIPAGGIHDEERESLGITLAHIQAAQKLMRPVAEQEG